MSEMDETATAIALSGPQPTQGDRINHWLRVLAMDMSMAERLNMVRHNRAGEMPAYSQEDIDGTVGEYEERIRWHLKRAGYVVPNPPPHK
jgi:hypothetical protein